MALNLEGKKAVVAQVGEVAGRAQSLLGLDYTGLDVAALTELRRAAREQGVHLQVVRNTLARRALEDSEFAAAADALTGPLLYAFSLEDPGAAARVVREFRKTHGGPQVRLVALRGRLLDADAAERLADMPTREQALSQLAWLMKAPVERLARTLAEPYAKLVRTLAAVRDQKQGS